MPEALPPASRLELLELLGGDVSNIADWKLYRVEGGSRQERELRPRTVNMSRFGFGVGSYTYLGDPLPSPLEEPGRPGSIEFGDFSGQPSE